MIAINFQKLFHITSIVLANETSRPHIQGALKGGSISKLSTFFVAVEGDPLEKKQIFEKKVSKCRKTERGDPLVSPGMVC